MWLELVGQDLQSFAVKYVPEDRKLLAHMYPCRTYQAISLKVQSTPAPSDRLSLVFLTIWDPINHSKHLQSSD